MDSPDNSQTIMWLSLLLAAGLGAAVYLLISPYISSGRRAQRRIQVVTEARGKRIAIKVQTEGANRKKSVADTLKEIEERQRPKAKLTLRAKLQQAGLDITSQSFYVASALSGVLVAAVVMLTVTSSLIAPVLAGFVGAFGLPYWILNKLIKRRQKKFLDEFANSIDVIVRGVKSGLPLNECLGIISREAPEPVSGEFREVVEQQKVGVTLAESFERMTVRVPLPEVRFFAIVIGISQQAGGNLSEALGNLSGVLRERKKLQGKVSAMSAEAKASAAVLASLPFCVMAIIYMTTPSFISTLWTTTAGNIMLICAGSWMICGLLVMKKMINFKY
ncbi:MAG: type II secretion system F family protein [Hyphomicrobiaceae bacterium]|nr:type II secretion system F family protein [Hyphomicrobiaceae bacterium]